MKYPRHVVIDTDTHKLTVGDDDFPWPYMDAEPTLVVDPDGNLMPALKVTILCADLTAISPGKVIDDGE